MRSVYAWWIGTFAYYLHLSTARRLLAEGQKDAEPKIGQLTIIRQGARAAGLPVAMTKALAKRGAKLMDDKVTHTDLWHAFVSFAKNTASLLIALGVIMAAVWYSLEPRVIQFLDNREIPTRMALSRVETAITELKATAPAIAAPAFIEFRGSAVVPKDQTFMPGETVPVTYLLRRNRACETDIEVRFFSVAQSRIDTSLTYKIIATQATVNKSFGLFTIDVRLPDQMKSGWYSYSPILSPSDKSCGMPEAAPISGIFKVVADG